MKLFEYEGKEIVKKYNIEAPRGFVASSPDEVSDYVTKLGGKAVLKAQVLVGRRGIAGGIRKVHTVEEAVAEASRIFSMSIYGEKVGKILVEEMVPIAKELYLSLTVDRAERRLCYLVSELGGIEVEELVRKYPDKLLKIYLDPLVGYQSYMARLATSFLNLPQDLVQKMDTIMRGMYNVMVDYDAELVEFNPLALTNDNKLIAVDVKIIIDDNALFRHPEIAQLLGRELSLFERKAREIGVNYVELDGEIGVMANGAGLTMSTMDLVIHYGGRPAVFLDTAGGLTRERAREALKLLLLNDKVKAIMINIFAGFTRCDDVANGIIDALNETKVKKPIVVRMIGLLEDEGRRMLASHGIEVYREMEDAVKRVVEITLGLGR